MGNSLRDGKLIKIYPDSGKREYELNKDGYKLTMIVGERNNNEKTITFYSDKNLGGRQMLLITLTLSLMSIV